MNCKSATLSVQMNTIKENIQNYAKKVMLVSLHNIKVYQPTTQTDKLYRIKKKIR